MTIYASTFTIINTFLYLRYWQKIKKKKKKWLPWVVFMEEHVIIMSLRSYPQVMVFAACEVNRDVWYGATNLMSCKIKTRLCRWIWEDGNFHALSHALLRDHYGLDYIWKDLGMLWSMHTLFVTSFCYFTVIQALASVPRYLFWQCKLLSGNISKNLNAILSLGKEKKERGEERQ